MLTDWILVRRLAYELREHLLGGRVQDVGLLPDGRVALAVRRGGKPRLLAVDAFASPPVVTIEDGELGIAVERGFVRAAATALRGMALCDIQARTGDRLLELTFAARSRFGVAEELTLFLELVPRFGNLVLTKAGVVIAAVKEFPLAENPSRAIRVGLPYALPPLPSLAAIPKSLRDSGLEAGAAARAAERAGAADEALYVYRRDGTLLQAHVAPLAQFADADCTREASLLAVFAEFLAQRNARGRHERSQQRRHALCKRLRERADKLRGELVALAGKRRDAEQRDRLRTEGDRIFATLHERSESEREAAKEQAVKLFARYKKLGASLPHVDAREAAVCAVLEAVEALEWEAERSGDEDLADVESAAAHVLHAQGARATALSTRNRKRAPLEFRTPLGSRIVVGRSPTENDDLTFRLARPNDLWFHARGIPGAHVILTRDDRSAPPDEDVRVAAAAAAFHSRGKASRSVSVDYTARKHVRKRPGAAPGLVWYTRAQTIAVLPSALLADGGQA